MPDDATATKISFDAFELHLKDGEIRKDGIGVKLAPQPFSVLAFLARRAGQIVTREEIHRAIWDEGTFVDFELGLNQCIRQIRTALDDDARDPRYIETLSRRGYRFKAPVQQETDELPAAAPSATGSMAQTETPPIGRTPAAPAAVSPPAAGVPLQDTRARPLSSGFNSRHRVLVLGVCAAVVIALAVAAIRRGGFSNLISRDSKPIRSLAVLPFRNLSSDPAQEYFAEGMTDQIITDLAQIPTLRIISRTSVMQYKDTQKTLPVIARELDVDAVVEGSVTHDGSRVRITAQLVESNPEKHLWAKSYERSMGDALNVQGEIAEDIATEIRVKLTPQERTRLNYRRSENPAAEDAYLKGHYYFQQSQSEWDESAEAPLSKSIGYFQRATEIDSNFALAYTGLATAYDVLLMTDVRNVAHQPASVSAKAKAAALKALQIDGASAQAHTALAWDRFVYDWDWTGAEAEFKRAIALDPGYSTGHYWYAMYLSAMGRHDEAISEIRLAEKLDPVSPGTRLGGAWVFYQARRYDDAIAEDHAALALNPNSARAHYALGWADVKRGLFQQAAAEFQKGAALSHGDEQTLAAYMAYLHAVSGEKLGALRLIRGLEAHPRPVSISPYVMAEIYTALGEKARAFASLEKAYEQRQFGVVFLKVDPDLDGLRPDPRFATLLRRMNLSD